MVRYRTGDLVRLDRPGPGPYPTATLRPLGRVRDVVPLGGREVTAYEIEDAVLRRVRGVLDYQLLIGRRDGKDVLTVRLDIPHEAARDAVDEHAVIAGIREELGVGSQLRYGPADAITSTGAMVSWKAARIHDTRGSEEPERRAALAIAGQRAAR